MKLSDQCCTVEQGKRLVELGVDADATFWWMPAKSSVHGEYIQYGYHSDAIAPAYNVAELGELLPAQVWYTSSRYNFTGWVNILHIKENVPNENDAEEVSYTSGYGPELGDRFAIGHGLSTEAQARASLFIFLLENDIITLKPTEHAEGNCEPK